MIFGIFEDAPFVGNRVLDSINDRAIIKVIIAPISQDIMEAYPAIFVLYSAVNSQLEPINDVIPTPTKLIKLIFFDKPFRLKFIHKILTL